MKLCGFEVGLDRPFFLIAGPCVIESRAARARHRRAAEGDSAALGMPFIFKSSYDKANRSSGKSSAAWAWTKACEILAEVKRRSACRC